MLVPTADKTMIIMIPQINDYNDTHNIYISSKNLLMFTPRTRCNNRYKDGRRRVWHDIRIFFFKNFEKRAEVFDKVIFLKNISFFVRFSTFAKQARVFLNFFGQWFLLAQQEWRFSNSF